MGNKITLKDSLFVFFTDILIFIGYMFFHNSAKIPETTKTDIDNTLYLDLEYGRVVIRMLPDIAPKHVSRIKELVRKRFYDGLTFHRVIEGFMVQGGDPLGNGTGGSGKNIPAEFTTRYSHKRGIVSMARAMNPNSADSQFFIVTKDAPHLDGQYTIWGYVVKGMEYVDKIKKGDIRRNGIVENPDKIIRMLVASDTEKK